MPNDLQKKPLILARINLKLPSI